MFRIGRTALIGSLVTATETRRRNHRLRDLAQPMLKPP